MHTFRASRNRLKFEGVLRGNGFSMRMAGAALLAAPLLMPLGAGAQWKPTGQVEIVVPNSPGGGNDTVARLMQKIWRERQLVAGASAVVNKPGGAGNVTLSYLSQKPGDGHFVAIVSVTQQLNYITGTSAFKYLDFTPLAVMIGDYVAFAVRVDSPLKSGKDVIERLKSDPGALSAGVTGIGGNNHVALVLAAKLGGVDTKKLKTPVFQSSGDSITALLGTHIDVHVGSVGPLMAHVQAGRVHIVAIASEQRLPGPLAHVPTWKEQGIDAAFNTWRGVWGPKGMSAEQIAYWDQVLGQVSQADEWKQTLERSVWVNDYRNSRDSSRYLDALDAKLKVVLKDLGLAKNL